MSSDPAAGLRIGLGVDAHRLGPGRPCMIGLVSHDHPEGLVGHSDGDVAAHALCDALLAAAGLPDIGSLFPPGDTEWEGASGRLLLGLVMKRVREAGLAAVNAHVVVMCEAPRIGRLREAMEDAMSAVVGARVTVHATTTETMGALGRGEGVAAQAVAMVSGAGR
ncbi:MAG: 2-C-methyl-D-erythritol 2,4-cyclodiphosphate synthase [Miltoncostaeaceae bacterium]